MPLNPEPERTKGLLRSPVTKLQLSLLAVHFSDRLEGMQDQYISGMGDVATSLGLQIVLRDRQVPYPSHPLPDQVNLDRIS